MQLTASDGWLSSSSNVNVTIISPYAFHYQDTNWLYIFCGNEDQITTNFYATNFDDSAWTNGQAAFGNYYQLCTVNLTNYIIKTFWPGAEDGVSDILLRRHFYVPTGTTNLSMGFTVDNDAQIFINGILITNAAQVFLKGILTNNVFQNGWYNHDGCPAYDDLILGGISPSVWHEGYNLLAVHAKDDGFASFFDARISCNSPLLANQPPMVFVWRDQFIVITNTAQLNGLVFDDGLPGTNNGYYYAQANWSKVSGPGNVTFSQSNFRFSTFANANTSASFTKPGTYILQLLANDTSLTATGRVTVVVDDGSVPAPIVNLIVPTNNAVYAMETVVPIAASASIDAGIIAKVDFYASTSLGNMLVGTVTNSPYGVDWIGVPPGNYSLIAAATDTTGRVGYSAPVNILVANGGPPTAVNDWFTVEANSANKYS